MSIDPTTCTPTEPYWVRLPERFIRRTLDGDS